MAGLAKPSAVRGPVCVVWIMCVGILRELEVQLRAQCSNNSQKIASSTNDTISMHVWNACLAIPAAGQARAYSFLPIAVSRFVVVQNAAFAGYYKLSQIVAR